MTLVEFIAPLKKRTATNSILAILYYKHRYEGQESLTVEEIRFALKAARVPRWSKVNVADLVAKSGHYVDTPGSKDGRLLWKLTASGLEYVRELVGLPAPEPELEHDLGALAALVGRIKDVEIKDYVEEAAKCLQVGALRASIVFLWSGAIRTIQNELLAYGAAKLNAAIQKHDPKARTVSKVDHFAFIKDSTALLAATELGLLDKNQKDTLEEALGLRNRCGHPGRYKPGPKRASSFIEDVATIVFA